MEQLGASASGSIPTCNMDDSVGTAKRMILFTLAATVIYKHNWHTSVCREYTSHSSHTDLTPFIPWTARLMDCSSHGLLVLWTLHPLDRSSYGLFITWTARLMDSSSRGPLVLWTLHPMDHSSYGLFIHWTVRL